MEVRIINSDHAVIIMNVVISLRYYLNLPTFIFYSLKYL